MTQLNPSHRRRTRGRRFRDDKGAVLIEFALIVPLFATLLLGAADFGFTYQKESQLITAVRQAGRVGSNLGNDMEADYETLQALMAVMESDADNIEKVIIYRSNTADGAVPSTCLSGSAEANRGVSNTCNVYLAEDINPFTCSDWGVANCANIGARSNCNGDIDDDWCPDDREIGKDFDSSGDQILDYFGVYVEYEHDYFSGLVGDTVTLSERVVMRVEPQPIDT